MQCQQQERRLRTKRRVWCLCATTLASRTYLFLLCVYLSVYLCLSASFCVFVSVSVCLCLSVCVSVCVSLSVSVCVSVRLYVCLFVCLLSETGLVGRVIAGRPFVEKERQAMLQAANEDSGPPQSFLAKYVSFLSLSFLSFLAKCISFRPL
eukprot:m.250194 g.250194  ORF g.250194 m.250194 type:complete len:151 (-) comp54505_c0_seq4:193-645(-)